MEKTTRRLPIVERDEWLLPAEQELNRRYERYTDKINAIEQAAGSIVDYANGYRYFGWQRDELLDGWWLREWLPGAHDVYVFGDFNNWQRTEIRMQRDAHGVWSAFFPEAMYRDRLRHGSLYKLHVHGDNGWKDRIPAYATRVVQDEATKNYTAQFWAPEPFDWQGDAFDASKNGSLMIYEAHVGMAQEKEGVGTYREFTEKILPIIKKDGYNAVQLMAIAQEDGVSAYGVLMYVDFIFKAFFFGYSIAVTPVVGYHYGAQNHAELKSLLRKSLIITALVSLVMTGASVTLAGPIADLFVGYDAALHDMTVNALRIYSVSFLVFGFNIFGSAFFTGLNDGTDSALISFLRTLVFQVAAILLLPRWLDINGIWLAVTAAESLTLLVTVSLLAAKRRKYHY